jgi:hypothetical protein
VLPVLILRTRTCCRCGATTAGVAAVWLFIEDELLDILILARSSSSRRFLVLQRWLGSFVRLL